MHDATMLSAALATLIGLMWASQPGPLTGRTPVLLVLASPVAFAIEAPQLAVVALAVAGLVRADRAGRRSPPLSALAGVSLGFAAVFVASGGASAWLFVLPAAACLLDLASDNPTGQGQQKRSHAAATA